jgi:hypothetical protein
MAAQYAFVMKDMTKSFPGAQKPVLNHSTCNSITAPRSASLALMALANRR